MGFFLVSEIFFHIWDIFLVGGIFFLEIEGWNFLAT